MKTKNIIFDLGGVLLELDYQRTVAAFERLGLSDASRQFTKQVQADLFQTFECGAMSKGDFLDALALHMPEAKPGEIVDAWCAMLGSLPEPRMALLEALSSRYRLFVLSNTNIIHQEAFETEIERAVGWNRFAAVFDHIGYSHILKARKPDADTFKKMLRLNGLSPKETFFVDDTEMHVQGARSVGIEAYHLKEGDDVTKIFEGW